ncbi:hypothetical protein BCR44DRAFT_82345 [Catenaria anguillulae PL171]|uniref:Galactose oxidase n=1 Tax=Catenaria anguillulae PL171 TaxID=765915 RepID=A0A1Y2HJT6_9FUNG|nr:hypothetical protein BCR44DRAFT_82345 [Catenaria anguillulae PL171]
MSAQQAPLVARWGHGAVIVGPNLYLLGGRTPSGSTSQVVKVDLSKSFTVTSPPYTQRAADLSAKVGQGLTQCRALSGNGNTPVRIRCIGGVETAGSFGSSLTDQVFNDATPGWLQAVATTGSPMPGPRYGHGLAYSGDNYWLFGGSTASPQPGEPFAPPTQLTNTMYKLDLKSNAWSQVSTASGANPPGLSQFTLTTLRSAPNLLVAIGGVLDNGNLAPMDKVWVFNTKTTAWREYSVGGQTPPARRGHASCSVGNFVYMFGGTNAAAGYFMADFTALIYDANADAFTWNPLFRPALSNYGPGGAAQYPIGRAFHQLTCATKRVFVTYGYSSQSAIDDPTVGMVVFPNSISSTAGPTAAMHLYDLDQAGSGGWTTTYNPPSNANDLNGDEVPSVQLPDGLDAGSGSGSGSSSGFWTLPAIIGIVCAGIAVVAAIIVLFCYMRSRSRAKAANARLASQVNSMRPTSAGGNMPGTPAAANKASTPRYTVMGPQAPLAANPSPAMPAQPSPQQPMDPYANAYSTAPSPGPTMSTGGATEYMQQQQGPTPAANLNILYMGPAQGRPPVVTTRPVIPVVQRAPDSASEYSVGPGSPPFGAAPAPAQAPQPAQLPRAHPAAASSAASVITSDSSQYQGHHQHQQRTVREVRQGVVNEYVLPPESMSRPMTGEMAVIEEAGTPTNRAQQGGKVPGSPRAGSVHSIESGVQFA